ncbi:dipeptide ABC transporter ATP-binding protein [Opitutales bacterium ASA1]|uniref:ATP-binding cassette domain-containing protein n=1 Tax=Congregicoccus parvus TaxID=3081749 RepID=UPI002B296534|nr:dipeptide ABC transporter ATP-binding protein [Opitutales bacterium ASA1]
MTTNAPLVSVRGATKTFRRSALIPGSAAKGVRALDGVSIDIPRGGTIGLVGESGSGKSTLGRCILRLVELDAGTIHWHEPDGRSSSIHEMDTRTLRAHRRRMQVVFQDPYHSLNPARPVWQIVGESLFIAGGVRAEEIRDRAAALLGSVGLDTSCLDRLPHAFSGGQRQRIAIARALAVEPEFLVCDEVTSALDTRTQAQVLDLLRELQARLGLTLLFISHDLHTVAAMSTRVAVMHAGRIVEEGEPERIFSEPTDAYTRALVAALPDPDPRRRTFRAS